VTRATNCTFDLYNEVELVFINVAEPEVAIVFILSHLSTKYYSIMVFNEPNTSSTKTDMRVRGYGTLFTKRHDWETYHHVLARLWPTMTLSELKSTMEKKYDFHATYAFLSLNPLHPQT